MSTKDEVLDVVIIGAGISGISSAWYLQKRCPGKTYAILEAREGMGGTWDLFRYPGIRSDSDMHTMGFAFKPWTDPKIISDGTAIREYIEETAAESGIDKHIRFGHKVVSASWDSESSLWTLTAEHGDRKVQLKCNFLHSCAGYYRYEKGYLPEFPGYDSFGGTLVHPQHWPEDLDYADKKVLIVGSGATAVTLLPAMAETAGHVTMLQRSPTYMVSRPAIDSMAVRLNRWLPASWAYRILRTKYILMQRLFFWRAKSAPQKVKEFLLGLLREQLDNFDELEKDFTPRYNPWDQRMCLVPDSDFFEAINKGKASVVTDEIETFTEKGIQLKSGKHLDADIIVTATGLHMQILQEVDFEVDGEPVVIRDRVIYKGAMLSDVPNMAFTMGYSNASWTLKADLTSRWVCRVLNYMKAYNYTKCVPSAGAEGIDTESVMNLNSGYVQRAQQRVPRQGTKAPWKLLHNYLIDTVILGVTSVYDGVLHFSAPRARTATKPEQELVKEAA